MDASTHHAQPWHEEARRLRAQGATIDDIAFAVDREPTTVRRIVVPGVREQQNATWARSYRNRYARDPAFRQKEVERRRAIRKRNAENPVWREQERQRVLARRADKARQQRERYATDPEYRARKLAQDRRRRDRRKKAKAYDRAWDSQKEAQS